MKKTLFLIVLAGICSAFLAGCGDGGTGGGTGEAPKKADTPEQALKNMALAVQRGDAQAFADCFEATEQEKKILVSLGEFMSATGELQKAVTETYGKAAAEDVAGSQQGPDFYDQDWLEKLNIKINDAKATVTEKGSKVFELVNKAGVWKILPEGMFGSGPGSPAAEDVEQAVKMFQGMAKIMGDAKAKVGKEGYTAKRIKDEIGAAMFKMLQPQMRFNPG